MTTSTFRITTEIAKQGCQYDKYNDKSKYPYINFLPFTAPSVQAQNIDNKLIESFLPINSFDLQAFRKFCTTDDVNNPIKDTTNCQSIKERINGINCDWIKYKGSSISNGVILQLHGGAFTLSSHIKLFAQSELLSKLTGMVCLCIDYSKAPEYPLPAAVNDVVSIYKYLINEKKLHPTTQIFMAGGSAGGGLVLLTIQKLRDLGLSQPCAVWMESPWTDLSKDGITMGSKRRNKKVDIITGGGDWLFECSEMVVGNKNINGEIVNKFDLKDKRFSGLYGDFRGLCPMYFSVCATEILLDDTIFAAEKAYKSGVDVRVDIVPFMLHCFGENVNHMPEAYNQCIVASEWLKNQQRKKNLVFIKSRL